MTAMLDELRAPATEIRCAGNVEAQGFAIAGPLLLSVRRF